MADSGPLAAYLCCSFGADELRKIDWSGIVISSRHLYGAHCVTACLFRHRKPSAKNDDFSVTIMPDRVYSYKYAMVTSTLTLHLRGG